MMRWALSGWCAVVALATLGLAGASAATAQSTRPSPTPTTQKAAIPAGTEIHLAQKQLDELRSRPGRRYAPADLVKLAGESSPGLMYVAARTAMKDAVAARNVPIAKAARDLIIHSFDVEPAKIDHAFAKSLVEAQVPEQAAIVSMRSMESSLAQGNVDLAEDFRALLSDLIPALPQDLAGHAKGCLADTRMAADLRTRMLSQAPSPAKALFECLYLGKWQDNLRQLAESVGDFAVCARGDREATDPRGRFAAAESWWLTAQSKGTLEGWRVAVRAMQIYDEILPQLSGVERELVLARKSEHYRAYMIRNGYRPGVTRDISRDRVRTREEIAELDLAKDAPEIPSSRARVVLRGLLLVEFPGQHEFVLKGGSGMRVLIDQKELLNDDVAYRKRSGHKVDLAMTAGLHSFEIELWSASSKPRLLATWKTPAFSEQTAIPASVLFIDPLAIEPRQGPSNGTRKNDANE